MIAITETNCELKSHILFSKTFLFSLYLFYLICQSCRLFLKVSFITDDDENNCDEDIEDEFKLRRSLDFKFASDNDFNKSLGLPESVLSRQLSQSTEDDEEEEEDDESNSGDAKETVFYMPSVEIDADSNRYEFKEFCFFQYISLNPNLSSSCTCHVLISIYWILTLLRIVC